MENNISKFLFVVEKLVVNDMVLHLVIVLLLIVFIIQLIKDLKDVQSLHFVNLTNMFYKFLKLQYIFIFVFLLHILLLLGLLNYNLLECLINKCILAFLFFIGSTIIYLIDIIFIKLYIKENDQTENYNVDNFGNVIKINVTILFLIYFVIGLYAEIIILFL